jgi:hypothetical protein
VPGEMAGESALAVARAFGVKLLGRLRR